MFTNKSLSLKHTYIFILTVIFILLILLNIITSDSTPLNADTMLLINYMDNDNKNNIYRYPFPFYIFQIGFNKCGVTSLYRFFMDNGIPSIQYRINQSDEYSEMLTDIMFDRYKKSIPILPYNGTKYMYYGDFGEYILNGSHDFDILYLNDNNINNNNQTWYKILLKQYPRNSKFILNIRNVNNWLRSRYTYRYPNYSTFFIKQNI
eukprot:79121_1